ncbi:alkaline phosphatase [Paenibacillus tianmuensis]|uniref:Alkaline phosphatase n=2 Tax=Paenibacillus tianmuensis TaxID=624147 RepID=A0A1G4RB56_9BACL|nr:alkaline phosphatase [Paenibacillus tianmuensis]
MMKKKATGLFIASFLLCNLIPASLHAGNEAAKPLSKNLIVLIGDGMGPAQVTAARLYSKTILGAESLHLDGYYVGQASTFSERGEVDSSIESGLITDSSAAGTALATGHKTYNSAVSVSNHEVAKPYASVIEAAEAKGKATGLVTTARITHATPAAFASHVRSRGNETAIASQMLESGVDVLLGGGADYFTGKDAGGKRQDKTILPDFEAKGYSVVKDLAGLQALTVKHDKVLGLFNRSHLDYAIDRNTSSPSLADLTGKAIKLLSAKPEGFVLMIEGGRIDHAAHANDFPTMVKEMLDFDAAVKTAMDFAKKDGSTSVVVTADHETGGLSLGRDNMYELNIDLWNRQKSSSQVLNAALEQARTPEEIRKFVQTNTTITDLSDEEARFILKGDGSDYEREGAYNAVISKRLLVGWSGHAHSGVDVGVWAFGPIAELVKGKIDNTDIAKAGANTIGVDLDAVTAGLQAKYWYPKFKTMPGRSVVYPAKALAAKLGASADWDEASGTVRMAKGGKTILVNLKDGSATLNGQTAAYAVHVEKGTLYLSLNAFNDISGQSMTWDPLSERLVLQAG